MNQDNLELFEKNDPHFVDDLKKSNDHVWRIAKWLQKKGYAVTVLPLRIREKIEDMSQFSDSGDIEIRQRVEVKQRFLDFHDKESYPFQTVIVDVAHTWDNARPKPFAYIITNKSSSCCLMVKGDTKKHWKKVEKMDKKKQRMRTFYECPIEYCEFFRLGEC